MQSVTHQTLAGQFIPSRFKMEGQKDSLVRKESKKENEKRKSKIVEVKLRNGVKS
jgi:hypothetical protein